jgi:hypothetical protein
MYICRQRVKNYYIQTLWTASHAICAAVLEIRPTHTIGKQAQAGNALVVKVCHAMNAHLVVRDQEHIIPQE